MRAVLLSLLFGMASAFAGGALVFFVGVLLADYKTDWLYDLGLDGPPGGAFFLLSIVLLAMLGGFFGFRFALNRLRQRQGNSR
jgi:hypothetical protein